jgi:hypothetical protein
MLLHLALVVVALAGVATASVYWQMRIKALAAYKALQESKGDAVRPAANVYWPLDKRAKYWALGNMAFWVANVILLSCFPEQSKDLLGWICIGASMLSMWSVSIVAGVYNDREFMARLNSRF